MLDIESYADAILENDTSKNWYPVWYYKQLKAIPIDFVVFNLLTKKFVVEIDSAKYGLEFFNSAELGMQMRFQYDDLSHNKILNSSDILDRAFRQGSWYQVLKTNTSKAFKDEYRKQKHEKCRNDLIRFLRRVLDEKDDL